MIEGIPLYEIINPRAINKPEREIKPYPDPFLLFAVSVCLLLSVSKVALNPSLDTSETISSTLFSCSTFIFPVEKLTVTLLTAGIFLKFFSILLAQLRSEERRLGKGVSRWCAIRQRRIGYMMEIVTMIP